MRINDNKEALQTMRNSIGSMENRMREIYNKGYKDGKRGRVMVNNLHRYGIMIHRKGTSYENDYWFRDNKYMKVREFSYDAAETVLGILKIQYGNDYSFRIRRLD